MTTLVYDGLSPSCVPAEHLMREIGGQWRGGSLRGSPGKNWGADWHRALAESTLMAGNPCSSSRLPRRTLAALDRSEGARYPAAGRVALLVAPQVDTTITPCAT